MRLISIDPGKKTGVASLIDGKLQLKTIKSNEVKNYIYQKKPSSVILEGYFPRSSKVSGADIKFLPRFFCELTEYCYEIKALVVVQHPSVCRIKKYVNERDRLIKELGIKRTSEHSRDALTHLLYFIGKQGIEIPIERG